MRGEPAFCRSLAGLRCAAAAFPCWRIFAPFHLKRRVRSAPAAQAPPVRLLPAVGALRYAVVGLSPVVRALTLPVRVRTRRLLGKRAHFSTLSAAMNEEPLGISHANFDPRKYEMSAAFRLHAVVLTHSRPPAFSHGFLVGCASSSRFGEGRAGQFDPAKKIKYSNFESLI